MAAIRSLDWDIFTTHLREWTDAIGEDTFDRPGLVDQATYNRYFDQSIKFYNEKIAPRIDFEQQAALAEIFDQLKATGQSNDMNDAISLVQQIFKTVPELSGRFERYEEGVMRRKMVHIMTQANPKLQAIFDLHAKGDVAFFFDLDGSLIHAEPGRSVGYQADDRLQYVLNRLNVQSNSATAVVTGRPEVFMQQFFPQGAFFSATEHGVFVRDRVGGSLIRNYEGGQDMHALQASIAKEMAKRGLDASECYVEQEKEGSITVQFTDAADPQNAALHIGEILQQVMFSPRNAASTAPLHLVDGNVPGNRVMDLVPDTAEKGQTLEWFVNEYPNIFKGKTPIMVGDSGGDATAMQWVKDNGGFAIGVGPNAPAIQDINIQGVDMMRALVTSLAEKHLNANRTSTKRPFRLVI